MTESKPAPALLRAIAWGSIVMGVLMLLDFGMNLLGSSSADDLNQLESMLGSGGAALPQGMGSIGSLIALLFAMERYSWLISSVELVAGVAVLWSGIGLLRLRPWARTVTEVLYWLTLILLALLAVYWIWLWQSVQIPSASDVLDIDPASIRTTAIVVTVVVEVAVIIPTLWVLRYLRGPQVRAAVAGR